MSDKPMGERVTAVEVSLRTHIEECARKHEKAFRTQLVVLGTVLTVAAKLFGLL